MTSPYDFPTTVSHQYSKHASRLPFMSNVAGVFQPSIKANYRLRPLGGVLDREWNLRSRVRPRFPVSFNRHCLPIVDNGGMSIYAARGRSRPEKTSLLDSLTPILYGLAVEIFVCFLPLKSYSTFSLWLNFPIAGQKSWAILDNYTVHQTTRP